MHKICIVQVINRVLFSRRPVFWIFRTHGKTDFFSSTYLRYTELTPRILIRLQFYVDLSSSDTNIIGSIHWIQRNRPNFQRIKLKTTMVNLFWITLNIFFAEGHWLLVPGNAYLIIF